MTKSMPALAKQDESEMARSLNEHFVCRGFPYVAIDNGGSGHDNDVLVRHIETKKPIHDFEAKRSGGSRTDFGQFRAYYDNGWCFRETNKSTQITKSLFKVIKPHLDSAVYGKLPTGPSLSKSDAQAFWDIHQPNREKSVCGDILRVPIAASTISDYYLEKGNDYIKIGDDLYSLGDKRIPTLESMIEECDALLRIKYHSKDRYSYTVALRAKLKSAKNTDFLTALNKIY